MEMYILNNYVKQNESKIEKYRQTDRQRQTDRDRDRQTDKQRERQSSKMREKCMPMSTALETKSLSFVMTSFSIVRRKWEWGWGGGFCWIQIHR